MTNTTLRTSGIALPKGHELLWYEIDSVLGHGGFGITYLAHDKNLGRDVALKEYLPRSWAERQPDFGVIPLDEDHRELYEKGLTRFMAEARTLAKFKHPNIVHVLTVFEQHQTAYMAMEYEQGGSLSDLLRNQKFEVTQESLLGILLPISHGLENVHDMGFLHRDIKPANIYLRDDGSPVLIDFGSSRETGVLNTSDVTVLITQGYAPAEQYSKGFGEHGPWTDIYSLAASIYHTISGTVVADALQRNAAVQSGGKDPFNPLSTLSLEGYTEEFKYAIDKALENKPADRPQSLAEWRELLAGNSEAATSLRTAATEHNDGRGTESSTRSAEYPDDARRSDTGTAGDTKTRPFDNDPAHASSHASSHATAQTEIAQPAAATPAKSNNREAEKRSPIIAYAAMGITLLAALGGGAYFMLGGDKPDDTTDSSTVASVSTGTTASPAPSATDLNKDSAAEADSSGTDSSAATTDTNEETSDNATDASATDNNETVASSDSTQNQATVASPVTPEPTATVPTATEQTATEQLATEQSESKPSEQAATSITDGLPVPDVAVEMVSPFATISAEIDALTAALNRYKQDLADDSGNDIAQAAIKSIGAKFTMLANTTIVKSNSTLNNATAEGLVKSVGVTAENQTILAELVRSNSLITEEYLKGLLTSASLTSAQRESLIFGLASSPAETRASLQSDASYNQLIDQFKGSIVAEIKLRNFPMAARMTSLALLIEPEDESLKLLSNHLLQSR